VQADALSTWQRHAQATIEDLWQTDATSTKPALRTWLVGISEGAELLPLVTSTLAASQPGMRLAGMVLIGASGLDPREAGALQAQRLGAAVAWQSLEQAVRSDLPDTHIHQGRSLRYWRDMWGWQLTQPLLQSPLPILQVWGQADALVPQVAYERFADQAQNVSPARAAPWCSLSLPDADHGLQTPTVDGVQQVWSALEQWERQAGPSGLAQSWRCVKGVKGLH
jgi:pimeloyl-ACP methyl ester carboxylesterase